MAANYPTTNEYSTDMGMGQQPRVMSGNLRQAGINQRAYGPGPSYQPTQSYGATASNQARSNPWGRGGGQDWNSIRQPGTGPYNPNPTDPRQTVGQGQQPSTYQPTPYQAPPQWTPYQVQQPTMNQGQQQTATPWNPGVPTTPAGWNTQALRDQYSQYMATMLPYQQYQQNANQYATDFNEAQRRWNEQFGWTQQGDRFNQDLSTRQQQMAEWQAQEAARQWGDQFGWQRETDMFSQDLANRQLGLQQQQLAVEEAYNQGRLTNEQRQLALQELQAGQDEAWRRDQLAQQLGFSREELQSRDQLARWQQEQQAAMQAQQLEAQRQNAILQATGRNQAPNVKWMRRSA